MNISIEINESNGHRFLCWNKIIQLNPEIMLRFGELVMTTLYVIITTVNN
jgi:hypothetical protein